MSVLDFIFGTKEENDAAYADRLNTAASTEPTMDAVAPLSRPMSSGDNDRFVGFDDGGSKVFETMTGQRYTLNWDTDQRTPRQKVEQDVVPVVSSYMNNPTLPSAQQVGTFAKDVVVGGLEGIDTMVSGQGTYGDVLGAASGVGGAAYTFGRKPADNALGMFLNKNSKGADLQELNRAISWETQGVPREDIWRDTGWGKLNGEWLSEIDDSKSSIAANQKYRPPVYKEETVTRSVPLSQQARVSLKVSAQKEVLEIRRKIAAGTMSQQEAMSYLGRLEEELKVKLNSAEQASQIVRTPVQANLRETGTLEQVLHHDDFMNELPQDMRKTSAEAGRRLSTSAGHRLNTVGVYSPRVTPDSELAAKGKSRVSSFKNAGSITPSTSRADVIFQSGSPADLEIFDAYKAGKIPLAQANADLVWSTMLHEGQHLLDDVNQSPGAGFNSTRAPAISSKAKRLAAETYANIKGSQEYMNIDADLRNKFGVRQEHLPTEILFQTLDKYKKLLAGGPDWPAYDVKFNEEMALDSAAQTIKDIAQTDANITLDDAKNIMRHTIASPDAAAISDEFLRYENSRDRLLGYLSDHKIYQREAGEAKSRLTQARRNLNQTQRSERPFWLDLDVPEEEIFFESDY